MSEKGTPRKIYPEKISIVNVTTEMRQEMDQALREGAEITEAELVREAIKLYLSRWKRTKKKDEQS
jgi:Arc/MetJ-type ribon-helix-helix transcriptional regulator